MRKPPRQSMLARAAAGTALARGLRGEQPLTAASYPPDVTFNPIVNRLLPYSVRDPRVAQRLARKRG